MFNIDKEQLLSLLEERKDEFIFNGNVNNFPGKVTRGAIAHLHKLGISYQKQWWFIQWKYLLRKEIFFNSKYRGMEGYDDFKAFLHVLRLLIDKEDGELSESLEDEIDLLRRKK